MKVLDQLSWRYATKKFDPKKMLSESQMEILTESVRLTPTSYGLQPLKLIDVRDEKLRELILPAAFNQLQVLEASHLLVLCSVNKIDEFFIDDYISNISKTRELPKDELGLSAYKKTMLNILEWSPEQKNTWMKNQVYIALGSLLTVCAFEQIDACPMEGFDPIQIDDVLGLRELGLSSVLLCPVGYRHPEDPFAEKKKVRKPASEFLIQL